MVPALFIDSLHYVFSFTQKTSTFSYLRKVSRIYLIFNTGDLSKVENYRHVPKSLLQVFQIVLDNYIINSVMFRLSASQHEFVLGRLTTINFAWFCL